MNPCCQKLKEEMEKQHEKEIQNKDNSIRGLRLFIKKRPKSNSFCMKHEGTMLQYCRICLNQSLDSFKKNLNRNWKSPVDYAKSETAKAVFEELWKVFDKYSDEEDEWQVILKDDFNELKQKWTKEELRK